MILLTDHSSGVNFLMEFKLWTFAACYVQKRVSGNSHVYAAGQHSGSIQQIICTASNISREWDVTPGALNKPLLTSGL